MKSLLQEFAAYNIWANTQLTDCILTLDIVNFTRTVPGSFPSLHKTLLHMWDADSIWWQRVQAASPINIPSKYFSGTTKELIDHLLAQDAAWEKWVKETGEEELHSLFEYSNSKGDKFEQPLYQVIAHLFNHGTYHRGQLVTMLRSLEVNAIPQTDFVHWAREVKGE
ncbi:DinB family protein [Flavihumibacter profundi]|jgi:uncharacterized damage-inducible protein DinB|uniref:DinB family protein n=1 Tax=Flavihumibacter profundi TaxID=2716883 RepID=UPI001CC67B4B|nr:DinB family protein [Flavihumibacter profundi]MBZ5857140.1 hypothetical protein [Flavihumibacter profundi]